MLVLLSVVFLEEQIVTSTDFSLPQRGLVYADRWWCVASLCLVSIATAVTRGSCDGAAEASHGLVGLPGSRRPSVLQRDRLGARSGL